MTWQVWIVIKNKWGNDMTGALLFEILKFGIRRWFLFLFCNNRCCLQFKQTDYCITSKDFQNDVMDLNWSNWQYFDQYFDPLRIISIIILIHLEIIEYTQEISQAWNFQFDAFQRNTPFRVILVYNFSKSNLLWSTFKVADKSF